MKQKSLRDGTVVHYGFADPEMYKALRQHRSIVVPDKKKQQSKRICRNHKEIARGSADFL